MRNTFRLARWVAAAGLTIFTTAAWADADLAPNAGHYGAAAAAGDATPTDSAQAGSAQPWRMPPIRVAGKPAPELREEDRIGSYGQPRWTANRRFPTTRVYVVPQGKATVEYWQRVDAPLSNLVDGRKIQSYYELELGLGNRLQLDIYLTTEQSGYKGDFGLKKEKLELRYALADWGQLWGNPTLYAEYSRVHQDADYCEFKLLLGNELAPSWHWGANLAYERQLGGAATNEYALSLGLSKAVVDSAFAVGVETKLGALDGKGARFKSFLEQYAMVGPSLSFAPVPAMHVLATVLLGVGKEGSGAFDGVMQSWLIAGWTL